MERSSPQINSNLSLSSPELAADVVDLLLGETHRFDNSLLILPCDAGDISSPPPLIIGGTEWFAGAEARTMMMSAIAEIGSPAVIAALSSPRPLPPEVVVCWHRTAYQAFGGAGTRLLGFFTAWSRSSVEHVDPTDLRA